MLIWILKIKIIFCSHMPATYYQKKYKRKHSCQLKASAFQPVKIPLIRYDRKKSLSFFHIFKQILPCGVFSFIDFFMPKYKAFFNLSCIPLIKQNRNYNHYKAYNKVLQFFEFKAWYLLHEILLFLCLSRKKIISLGIYVQL